MKTNKKAILGFAVAMVFSLAFMQGMSIKHERQNMTLMGWGASAVSSYASSEGEHGLAAAWAGLSGFAYTGAGSIAVSSGWSGVGLIGAGVLAL